MIWTLVVALLAHAFSDILVKPWLMTEPAVSRMSELYRIALHSFCGAMLVWGALLATGFPVMAWMVGAVFLTHLAVDVYKYHWLALRQDPLVRSIIDQLLHIIVISAIVVYGGPR